jgi:hypothetical protein
MGQGNLPQEPPSVSPQSLPSGVHAEGIEERVSEDICEFISWRLAELSQEKFFAEASFWRKRVPVARAAISRAEALWLDANLEKLRYESVCSEFIKNGKHSENPQLYVMLSILKTVSAAIKISKEISVRYLLGNYSLAPENYTRLVRILIRIFAQAEYTTHRENIEFLFREQGTGVLNVAELNVFLAEHSA